MANNKRDRRAWIAIVVLAPVLVYMLWSNFSRLGRKSPPPAAPAAAAPAVAAAPAPTPAVPVPLAPAVSTAAPVAAPVSTLNASQIAEQQKIAARLPRRNPFGVSAEIAAITNQVAPAPTSGVVVTPPVGEPGMKIGAIMTVNGKRMAMINGRLLGAGDRLGEWTVVRVNPNNVLLDNGTRQMTVGSR